MTCTRRVVMVLGVLLALSAVSLHAAAELTEEQAVEKVTEGAQNFCGALKEGASKDEKKQSLRNMYDAFKAAFEEKKHDAAVAAKIEERAEKVADSEDRALLYYFVCDSYHQIKRLDKALDSIDKALALDDKEAYKNKKQQVEEAMKR